MMCFDISKYNDTGIFIETGTERGGGVERALEAGFEEIYSMELAPNLYLSCVNKFWKHKNVHLYYGDCVEVLEILLKNIEKPVTLWLDAHIDNGYVENPKYTCPVLKELDILWRLNRKNDYIFIDDRRKFGEKGDWGEKVTEEMIIEKLKAINCNFDIVYENGIQEKDVIGAIPK